MKIQDQRRNKEIEARRLSAYDLAGKSTRMARLKGEAEVAEVAEHLDLGIRVDVVKILALPLIGCGASLTLSFLICEMG